MIEIIYPAKCKDCSFLEKGKYIKNDGAESKKTIHFCNNEKSPLNHQALSLKNKACDYFNLIGT